MLDMLVQQLFLFCVLQSMEKMRLIIQQINKTCSKEFLRILDSASFTFNSQRHLSETKKGKILVAGRDFRFTFYVCF